MDCQLMNCQTVPNDNSWFTGSLKKRRFVSEIIRWFQRPGVSKSERARRTMNLELKTNPNHVRGRFRPICRSVSRLQRIANFTRHRVNSYYRTPYCKWSAPVRWYLDPPFIPPLTYPLHFPSHTPYKRLANSW